MPKSNILPDEHAAAEKFIAELRRLTALRRNISFALPSHADFEPYRRNRILNPAQYAALEQLLDTHGFTFEKKELAEAGPPGNKVLRDAGFSGAGDYNSIPGEAAFEDMVHVLSLTPEETASLKSLHPRFQQADALRRYCADQGWENFNEIAANTGLPRSAAQSLAKGESLKRNAFDTAIKTLGFASLEAFLSKWGEGADGHAGSAPAADDGTPAVAADVAAAELQTRAVREPERK